MQDKFEEFEQIKTEWNGRDHYFDIEYSIEKKDLEDFKVRAFSMRIKGKNRAETIKHIQTSVSEFRKEGYEGYYKLISLINNDKIVFNTKHLHSYQIKALLEIIESNFKKEQEKLNFTNEFNLEDIRETLYETPQYNAEIYDELDKIITDFN